METLQEPSRSLPVIHEADVCVLGGSCTGVFAAIRAARLGAKVVLVEQQNAFGGVATNSLVCVWHSLWDTEGKRQIIAGLTAETTDRLDRRGALERFAHDNPNRGFTFNPSELKIELDEMVLAAGIKPYLHTMFVAPLVCDGELQAVIVENKSGRGAIRAKMFIDATGDADLAARLGCETYFANHMQPSTTCAQFSGWDTLDFGKDHYSIVLGREREKFGLPPGFAWGSRVPGSDEFMLAGTRIHGTNPANADDLTRTEIEGRRQVRAIMDIFRAASPGNRLSLTALPSRVGLRESRHVRCGYQLTGDDVLWGKRFDDAVANGSYRVDIHHQDKPGITLRYLDGREQFSCPGMQDQWGRWRPETPESPTFYQIPYRSMLPGTHPNLLIAGRMIDADPVAHGGIRVMVNMNQTGEAAGVASVLALESGGDVRTVDVSKLRATLNRGGSLMA